MGINKYLAGLTVLTSLTSLTGTTAQEPRKNKYSQELINFLTGKPYQQDTVNTIKFDSINTVKIDDIRKSPLFMRGTNRHIGEFLGYNQYEKICEKYNNIKFNENSGKEEKSIKNFSEISFPLIYDGLDSIFPKNLDELLQKEQYEKYKDEIKENNNDLILITENGGLYVLGFYKNGKLFLATHVSIGKGNSTPKGIFKIGQKSPRATSKKYNNAPMPYSLHLQGNYFIHQGKVTGKGISHGCIRVPGLYQIVIYENAKNNTPVIIDY